MRLLWSHGMRAVTLLDGHDKVIFHVSNEDHGDVDLTGIKGGVDAGSILHSYGAESGFAHDPAYRKLADLTPPGGTTPWPDGANPKHVGRLPDGSLAADPDGDRGDTPVEDILDPEEDEVADEPEDEPEGDAEDPEGGEDAPKPAKAKRGAKDD